MKNFTLNLCDRIQLNPTDLSIFSPFINKSSMLTKNQNGISQERHRERERVKH